jgi:hypothetical protein
VAKKTVEKVDIENEKDKQELIEIFNSLAPSTKNQLLSAGRIILNTQNLILDDIRGRVNILTTKKK